MKVGRQAADAEVARAPAPSHSPTSSPYRPSAQHPWDRKQPPTCPNACSCFCGAPLLLPPPAAPCRACRFSCRSSSPLASTYSMRWRSCGCEVHRAAGIGTSSAKLASSAALHGTGDATRSTLSCLCAVVHDAPGGLAVAPRPACRRPASHTIAPCHAEGRAVLRHACPTPHGTTAARSSSCQAALCRRGQALQSPTCRPPGRKRTATWAASSE